MPDEVVAGAPGIMEEARAWLAQDPDPDTRAELEALIAADDLAGLAARFGGSLRFGTAGLRGLMGAGPKRMNELVVVRATAGLCAWVLDQVPDGKERGIAIGYDGRKKSDRFATAAAEIVAGQGIKVHLFDRRVATPVLAYAVLEEHAAAGIMVTASHNPPAYNGYKVYWENGAQIIPPHDAGIAAAIACVGDSRTLPRHTLEEARSLGLLQHLGDPTEERYLKGVAALPLHPEAPRDFSIAYTALHGVGDRFARAALTMTGFRDVHSVASQAEPDGDFPTVAFPNPEEDGAMDAALALAKSINAELVLANDPDADRLAVAVQLDGGYRMLSGNEIGCLLGHYLLDQGDDAPGRCLISTVVSSPMLGAIAEAHGAHWEPTLTGFKWIANRALQLHAESDAKFIFGYEEALGYTVGTHVRDKDGISAAVMFADLTAWCRSRGGTVIGELEQCWHRYGMFMSEQLAVVLPGTEGAARIQAIMDQVRARPPWQLGEQKVAAVDDLLVGTRTTSDGATSALGYPPSNVIILDLGNSSRVMLRPSGTEPKIKYYVDIRVDLGEHGSIESSREAGRLRIEALVNALDKEIGEGGPLSE